MTPAPHRAGLLRPVQPAEVTLLAALQAACFAVEADPEGADAPYVGEAWSARSWAEILAMPGSFALFAVAAEAPLGFVAAQVLFEDGELLSLGVLPSQRRRGYGRQLLDGAIAEAGRRGASKIQLEVAENNLDGQHFYRRQGFTARGRRPKYYHNAKGVAIDALILEKALIPA